MSRPAPSASSRCRRPIRSVRCFSPDGKKIAITYTTANSIKLVVADVATAAVSPVLNGGINGLGGGCSWLDDSSGFLCALIPDGRGAPPAEPTVPTGPAVQENDGRVAPSATYEDLLKNPHDEALYEYFYTSQLAWVDVTGKKTPIGKPAIYNDKQISKDGNWLLVSHVKHPFSYVVPASQFPREVEIWDKTGKPAKTLADVPMADTFPRNGVFAGPARLPVASDRARDAHLHRGARQRRSDRQGPVPRSHRRDQSAVHRPAGRMVQDGMARGRRDVQREGIDPADGDRSRLADATQLALPRRRRLVTAEDLGASAAGSLSRSRHADAAAVDRHVHGSRRQRVHDGAGIVAEGRPAVPRSPQSRRRSGPSGSGSATTRATRPSSRCSTTTRRASSRAARRRPIRRTTSSATSRPRR